MTACTARAGVFPELIACLRISSDCRRISSGDGRRGVNHGDVAVALKIGVVESQDAFYRVDIHESHQPRIVYLDALDLIIPDNGLPCGINGWNIRQQGQQALDAADFPQRLFMG